MTSHQVGGEVVKNPLYTVLLNRENSKGTKSPVNTQEIGHNADFLKVYKKTQQEQNSILDRHVARRRPQSLYFKIIWAST